MIDPARTRELLLLVGSEVRIAARGLVRDWRFTTTAVLTTAIGIAGTTAVFTIVNAVILRPLPYPDLDRLVCVNETAITDPPYQPDPARNEWRNRTRVFEDFALWQGTDSSLMDRALGEDVKGERVTWDFFEVLGVSPLLGRSFSPFDAEARDSIILSHSLWRRHFGEAEDVIGKEIAGKNIIGVMPRGVSAPAETEYWEAVDPAVFVGGGVFMGRLAPGVTRAEAQQQLDRLIQQSAEEHGMTYVLHFISVSSIIGSWVADEHTLLLLLLGSSGGLLLIALMNVVNLVLSKSVTREREFQILGMLGMTRRRLLGKLLVESLLLSILAGALGVWLSNASMRLLIANLESMSRIREVSVDGTVVGFVLALMLGAALVFSLIPALRWSAAKSLGRPPSGSHISGAQRKARWALITVQIALAAIVLTGAVATGLSLCTISNLPTGLETDGVFVASLELPSGSADERAQTFNQELARRLQAQPDIESASLASRVPMVLNPLQEQVIRPGVESEYPVMALPYDVTGPYFSTLGIEFVLGGPFSETEPGLVINESLWHRLWGATNPIGEVVTVVGVERGAKEVSLPVVGVVADSMVDFNRRGPQVYRPCRRCEELFVRPRTRSARLREILETAVDSVDPRVAISSVRTMDEALSEGRMFLTLRSRMTLFNVFAGVGLFLGIVGVYGTTSYTTGQRAKEIAIRMALGSSRSRTIRDLMLEMTVPLMLGLTSGLWIAAVLGQFLERYLFEVDPLDPRILVAVGVSLAAAMITANLASIWPRTSAPPPTYLAQD